MYVDPREAAKVRARKALVHKIEAERRKAANLDAIRRVAATQDKAGR